MINTLQVHIIFEVGLERLSRVEVVGPQYVRHRTFIGHHVNVRQKRFVENPTHYRIVLIILYVRFYYYDDYNNNNSDNDNIK